MYEHLLSPLRIGSLEIPNRVAMAPMGVEIAEEDGTVRRPVVSYYEERARGGVGLLITENTSATYPRGANSARELGVSNDSFLPGLQMLTDAVHAHGSKIAIQLAHHGKVARLDTVQGRELLMPSMPRPASTKMGPLDLSREEIGWMAHAAGGGRPTIHEATVEDLEALVADFADAAERARRAGFDAVELHGAHGYIFSEFLSPATNFREDAYGGTVENRARLLCDTIRACKARAGDDFTVWCRIDAKEFRTTGGIELEHAVETAARVEAAGADAVHVSAYANPLGAGFTEGPIVHAEGGYIDFAAAVKAKVNIPVIAVGRIEPERGDRLIRDGKADVIAMGRKLLAEPELVAKLAAGRPEDIRPCIYCYTCVAQPFFDRTVKCAVNPMAARESVLSDRLREKSDRLQHVLIVGGGPAGLEAARVAALRGHEVTLWEKSGQLGGTLRFAALPYEPNERLLRWLEGQVRQLPIRIELNREATVESVRALGADVVMAATGARRVKPDVPGVDRDYVIDGDGLRDLLTGEGSAAPKLSRLERLAVKAGQLTGITQDPSKLRQASRAFMPIGRRVVIVGGGLVGVELAEFLVDRGREVTVLHDGPVLGLEMAHPRRWRALHELREAGVRLETDVVVTDFGIARVRFERAGDGAASGDPEVAEVPADSVILATGLEADPAFADALAEAGIRVWTIGDAGRVGYLEGAIHDGFNAAIDL